MVQTQSPKYADMDVNAGWKQFLQKKVNSFIKWDLVRFFHDNPHTADTAENIAQCVGRDVMTVRREMDGLVKSKVLESELIAGQQIYRLAESEDTRQLIEEFVMACHNRDFRVQAINHVIKGMGFTPRHDFWTCLKWSELLAVTDVSLYQLIVVYTWFPLVALFALQLLIARLYQKDFGKRTYFSFYVIPIILFGISSVRSASVGIVFDDPFGDIVTGAAGITLLVLVAILYRQMLRRKDF